MALKEVGETIEVKAMLGPTICGGCTKAPGARLVRKVDVSEESSTYMSREGLTTSGSSGDDACPSPAAERIQVLMEKSHRAAGKIDARMLGARPSTLGAVAEAHAPRTW